ncbi:hypothetical protein ABPG73_007739, partial [Tetrahymena malaccensis]
CNLINPYSASKLVSALGKFRKLSNLTIFLCHNCLNEQQQSKFSQSILKLKRIVKQSIYL